MAIYDDGTQYVDPDTVLQQQVLVQEIGDDGTIMNFDPHLQFTHLEFSHFKKPYQFNKEFVASTPISNCKHIEEVQQGPHKDDLYNSLRKSFQLKVIRNGPFASLEGILKQFNGGLYKSSLHRILNMVGIQKIEYGRTSSNDIVEMKIKMSNHPNFIKNKYQNLIVDNQIIINQMNKSAASLQVNQFSSYLAQPSAMVVNVDINLSQLEQPNELSEKEMLTKVISDELKAARVLSLKFYWQEIFQKVFKRLEDRKSNLYRASDFHSCYKSLHDDISYLLNFFLLEDQTCLRKVQARPLTLQEQYEQRAIFITSAQQEKLQLLEFFSQQYEQMNSRKGTIFNIKDYCQSVQKIIHSQRCYMWEGRLIQLPKQVVHEKRDQLLEQIEHFKQNPLLFRLESSSNSNLVYSSYIELYKQYRIFICDTHCFFIWDHPQQQELLEQDNYIIECHLEKLAHDSQVQYESHKVKEDAAKEIKRAQALEAYKLRRKEIKREKERLKKAKNRALSRIQKNQQ